MDQVQFLEKNFDLDNKLEPDRKIQLAKQLGLQPRQVAIWFQNRRARFKTKQLEKDYTALKTTYDNLKSDYDNLAADNDKLKTELQNLKDKFAIREKDKRIGKQQEATSASENLNSSMADSSHGFEPEQSDCFSQDEEENFSRNLLPICLPKLESCYYDDHQTEGCCNLIGFQIEDQAFGFWPYWHSSIPDYSSSGGINYSSSFSNYASR